MGWIWALVVAAVIFLSRNRRYRWFYILAKTYRRDFSFFRKVMQMQLKLHVWRIRNKSVAAVFVELVKRHPNKPAIYFEDETWTYSQLEDYSNQIARFFQNQGYKKGDSIALMLENRPEYPCIWLGLSKIGVITALINTNLVGSPLLHCIKIANCKGFIFGSTYSKAIENVRKDLQSEKLYQLHETELGHQQILPNCVDLRKELEKVSREALGGNFNIGILDRLMYIYTSGTTGLPKAAIITNMRYLTIAWGIHKLVDITPDDIMYIPLPLYHSAGGMLALGGTLVAGMPAAIRKKFSVTNYFKDCAKYKCTVAQYIGEMCRYLLATKQEPVQHSLRGIFGNGMRPQIWKQFVERFHIPKVYEGYGSTEGITNMLNMDNTVGSVGFVPRYLQWAYPVVLIKCDDATGQPIRNEKGRCVKCEVGEAGLLIGRVLRKHPLLNFKGYVDEKETKKKILQNVFKDEDEYFNSGDILLSDEFGSFFFKDRTGDTFRWKGENVSTSEVEAIISNLTQLNDATVYGVEIPNTEGRAGMAAIVDPTGILDLDKLLNGLKSNLPSYAIPLFIRVVKSVAMTGTFKLQKVELQSEGYSLDKVSDRIYLLDLKLGKYVDLNEDVHDQLMSGRIRV